MNRAARRGNRVWARGVMRSLAARRSHQVQSGKVYDALTAERPEPVRDGRLDRARGAGGRYVAGPLPVEPAPVELSRQQRRHAARQAAKRGGA